MNAPVFTPLEPPRPLLASDVMFLVEHGLIDPNAKFELLDGAIIPMSPKGCQHEAMRERIEDWLRGEWTSGFRVIRENTLVLDAETIVEPDFLLYDSARSVAHAPLTAADIKLVIEVADSSWSYDTTEKAAKYAAFGIADYWVIDATRGIARIHRGAAWSSVKDVAAGGTISPICAPTAVFKL